MFEVARETTAEEVNAAFEAAANGPLAVQAILKTMRDTEGMHELTEDQAHELGMALVRAADRLRRLRMEGQR